mmetsp:Transcript_20730/g.66741  ORF Transcript_20730/g.66741 Transcript_20730/m.66741 type:complete len:155 (-) Transcript_20730:78-542(-)
MHACVKADVVFLSAHTHRPNHEEPMPQCGVIYVRCPEAKPLLEAWAQKFIQIWRDHNRTSPHLADQPAFKRLVVGKGRFANVTKILPSNFDCRLVKATAFKKHPPTGPCLMVHFHAAHRLKYGSLLKRSSSNNGDGVPHRGDEEEEDDEPPSDY